MISSMLQGAVAHNEMVRSYEHAGFTRAEAISITTEMMLGHQRITAEIAEQRRVAEADRKRAEDQK